MNAHTYRTLGKPIYLTSIAIAFGATACGNSTKFVQEPNSITRNERPAWTPDGTRIVFSSKRDGNYELYVMNKDGSGQINITQTDTAELFPAISSTGNEIAFVGEIDGNYDIYVINIDGSSRSRLTHDARIDDWPTWRDDDETIIYDFADGDDYGIVRMDADGSNRRTLVDNAARTVDPNTVSASNWIVYSSDELDPGGNDSIFAYNIASMEIKQLTDLDIDVGGPALSRDGNKIVFNGGDEFWDLFIMNADGSDIRRLTSNVGDNRWGAFSPDGSEIAFTSDRNGNWHIYVMDVNGGNVRQLTGVDQDT